MSICGRFLIHSRAENEQYKKNSTHLQIQKVALQPLASEAPAQVSEERAFASRFTP